MRSPTSLRRGPSLQGCALLDTARGVVRAWTGADPVTANADLLATARAGKVDVFVLAAAVMGVCCGDAGAGHPAAVQAALDRWGPRRRAQPWSP